MPDEHPTNHDDGHGRCTICGGLADHRHTQVHDEPGDEILEVELAPEMIAAMGEADEVEVALELGDPDAKRDDGDG